MTVGPHVFKDNRRSLWVQGGQTTANMRSKLEHFLPRLRGAIPNLTDIFLPPECTNAHRQQVIALGFFQHVYDVAHGRTPIQFADDALARHTAQKAGALELNFEGSAITDVGMASYITATIKRVRAKKPNLAVRINVVPYKGQFLPVALINEDPNLFLCVQAYFGNMEGLAAPDDVIWNAVAYGVRPEKVTAMHAVMCAQRPGGKRQVTLPQVRNRGAFYIDDLLLDAGLLPS
jgi:hypothetical protein